MRKHRIVGGRGKENMGDAIALDALQNFQRVEGRKYHVGGTE